MTRTLPIGNYYIQIALRGLVDGPDEIINKFRFSRSSWGKKVGKEAREDAFDE